MGSIRSLGLSTEYVEQHIVTPEAVLELLKRGGKALYDYTFLEPTEEDLLRVMIIGPDIGAKDFHYRATVHKDLGLPKTNLLDAFLPRFVEDIGKAINQKMLDGPFMVGYVNTEVKDGDLMLPGDSLGKIWESTYQVIVHLGLIPRWVV